MSPVKRAQASRFEPPAPHVSSGRVSGLRRRRSFRLIFASLLVMGIALPSVALTEVAGADSTEPTEPVPAAEDVPVTEDAPVAEAPPAEQPAEDAPAPEAAPTTAGSQPILFWVGSNELDQLIDARGPQNLDSLQQAGIGGYAVITGLVEGFGGTPIPDWMVSNWRQIHDRGQHVYPGVYAASRTSPFADLFDDREWDRVRAGLATLADRAREGSASGMTLDLENYGVSKAMWTVSYPGNTHDEATTRAQMFQRGQEIAPIFASVGNLLIYSSSVAGAPGSYLDAVQANVGNLNEYANNMFPDFIRGLLAGGATVTVLDSVFTSGLHLPNRTWDGAIAESVGLTEGLFPGAEASIMVWPENGSGSPEAVALASRLSNGPVAIYQQHLIDGTVDYGPYLAELRAALG